MNLLVASNLFKTVNNFVYYLIMISFLFLSSHGIASNAYTIIPLEFCSQEPMVKIKLNGRPVQLIIDLGTSGYDLTLSKALLSLSNAKFINIDSKNYFTNYRREKYPIKNYLIENAEFGDFKLDNLSAIEFPGMSFFSDKPQKLDKALNNGTIGINLLKKFNVIFDYPNGRLILLHDEKAASRYNVTHWIKIPLHSASDNTLLVSGKVDGIPAKILIDSGNNALTISASFLKKLHSIANKQTSRVIINDLTIGDFHLKSKSYYIHNTHPEADISLGWDFLKDHQIYLNFKKLYLAIN